MTPRAATIYQLWCLEKTRSGRQLTEEENARLLAASDVTRSIAHRIMRVKPSDYEYTPGWNFDGSQEAG